RGSRALLPWVYLPGVVLGATRIVVVVRGASDGAFFSRALSLLDRVEPVYLFLCAVAAVAALTRAFGEITSLTGRRQLRWMAWGTLLGVGPFAVGHGSPG